MLHLVSLPHTETTSDYLSCAYTQKVVKFCRMMGAQGWEIVLYSGDLNEAPCTEHVSLLSVEERERIYGLTDLTVMPAWPDDWQLANLRAVDEIRARAEPDDIVLLAGGRSQRFIADNLRGMLVVEPFVGYEGVYCQQVAFESYAWQHHVYAKLDIDGRFFDTVIPNYFDAAEFVDARRWPGTDDEYLLFLGRLIERKGVRTAADIALAAGLQLVLAGPGDMDVPGDVLYAGPVGVEDRSRLLHNAVAVLAPTTYVEPFGGVAVEAMMCGTPAITTDWGAFTETVPGKYRFRTLRQAVDAVERARDADPGELREYAHRRFGFEAVAAEFEEWFASLDTLWQHGWYAHYDREVLT